MEGLAPALVVGPRRQMAFGSAIAGLRAAEPAHQRVGDIMRPLEQEKPMIAIGGELGSDFLQRGRPEAAAPDLRAEGLGNDTQAILARRSARTSA